MSRGFEFSRHSLKKDFDNVKERPSFMLSVSPSEKPQTFLKVFCFLFFLMPAWSFLWWSYWTSCLLSLHLNLQKDNHNRHVSVCWRPQDQETEPSSHPHGPIIGRTRKKAKSWRTYSSFVDKAQYSDVWMILCYRMRYFTPQWLWTCCNVVLKLINAQLHTLLLANCQELRADTRLILDCALLLG